MVIRPGDAEGDPANRHRGADQWLFVLSGHGSALVNGTDTALDAAVELLQRAALLGLPQAGWGFCYDWRHQAMRDLYAAVRAFVTRCDGRLAAVVTQTQLVTQARG